MVQPAANSTPTVQGVAKSGSDLEATSVRAANTVICDSYGAQLIAAERARQISEEGYDPAHDDEHRAGEIAMAAAAYALPATLRQESLPWMWPWSGMDFKPSPEDRIRELVKSGALAAAEIDRIKRAEANP